MASNKRKKRMIVKALGAQAEAMAARANKIGDRALARLVRQQANEYAALAKEIEEEMDLDRQINESLRAQGEPELGKLHTRNKGDRK